MLASRAGRLTDKEEAFILLEPHENPIQTPDILYCIVFYYIIFFYLSMLHYLCNTTCYSYLHLTFYTLYTYVLCPLYHPAVIVRDLLIQ